MTDINTLAEEIGAIFEREISDRKIESEIRDAWKHGHFSLFDVVAVLIPFAREGIAARKKQSEARDA